MAERPLLFEIFRLNIVNSDNVLFDFMGKPIRSDSEIRSVLQRAADSSFDLREESGRSIFRWSVREFLLIDSAEEASATCSVILGRSTLMQSGQTVTNEGFEDALTELSPPATETIHIFFYLRRHLVVVEHNNSVLHTMAWRTAFHSILEQAAQALEFSSQLRLEPVPQPEEILQQFRAFERLTRLRVKLRIPNPELDRRTERLRQEMVAGEIREYTQDMKNPAGLSKNEEALPYATVAMAQAGYKDGDVMMSGLKNGRRATVRTGGRAARGAESALNNMGDCPTSC